ncbi:hypothetical protein Shell_0264 [Staphylothermus hellenicus DSM 12710]|uniref:Roadblock/LC7 family protein n=2 Tax=Staphylothermus hellenicus TaxID=84599 RepID=D7DB55_STAHD|nr:hypothetical protein Shell_0264 [Staphylothermus hellenicus DSM 12710]
MGFAVAVIDDQGRVIDYSAPINMSFDTLREAIRLGYDVFRMINVIVREIGYEKPRNITVKMDNYEITVFSRGSKIVVVILSNEEAVPVAVNTSKATMET